MGQSLHRHLPLGLSLLVLLLASSLFVIDPGWLSRVRFLTFDAYQQAAPRAYLGKPVRIVDVDDASLQAVGQWPWPRTVLADLTQRLHAMGAAVVAYDMVFAEPDRYSPREAATQWSLSPELARALAELPDPDVAFADALAASRVVLGAAASDDPSSRPLHKHALIRVQGPEGEEAKWLLDFHGTVQSLPALQRAAAGVGLINFRPDAGSVIRSIPTVLRQGDKIVPSLGIEALRIALGERWLSLRFDEAAGLSLLKIGPHRINTDARGEFWLHYSGYRPERYVSAHRVLDGTADPARIAGNIVLIGSSASSLRDIRYTPHGWVSGVEIHAEALEQMLDELETGRYLTRPALANALELLATWMAWGLCMFVLARWGTRSGLLALLLALSGAVAGSWFGFTGAGLLLDPTLGIIALVLAFFTASIARHILTEMDYRRIRRTFSSYVSPDLVEHLLANRDTLNLAGELRECSFVMTDLQGFTGTMEQVAPERAVEVLNEYLDGMVNIAFQHQGMLDRIVGDAVAVIFSAPLPQQDHARRALECAQAMDEFAQAFALRWQSQGFPIRSTRIGVHTGEVVLGSVGGTRFKDYRALGDPINTASRLEGANKHLGTRLLVSGTTLEAIGGGDVAARMRPAGELVLAGKTRPLPVHVPLEAGRDAPLDAYGAWFAELEAGSPRAQNNLETLLEAYPDDPLLRLYQGRLARNEAGVLIRLGSK